MSVSVQNFSLISRCDGLRLYGLWVAPEKPVAILQLAHGMAEHKERYLPFMEYMAERGYACFLNDHRGHGQSVERPDKRGWFGAAGADFLVKDLYQVTQYAGSKYPGRPVYLMGHSMGSLAVRCYLDDHEEALSGLIVCGTPGKNPAAKPGAALAALIGKTKGETHRSGLLERLSTGAFDKAFPEEGHNSWLTRDKAVVEAYNADPLCGYTFTANGYKALMDLMAGAYAAMPAVRPQLPIHFLSGQEDPCHGGPENFRKSVDAMKANGYTNVTCRMYPGMRHEVLNEVGKEQVMGDLYALLEGWRSK